MIRVNRFPATGLCMLAAVLIMLAISGGCAAFRSDIGGAFTGESPQPGTRGDVIVAFIFTHAHQNRGWDVIPKLNDEYRYVNGFYDFFREALPELSNIGTYATFTEHADDVTNPARRAVRDSLAADNDYVIRMRFMRQTSFARQTMASIVSTLTLTLAPMPYARHYSVTADVHGRTGRLLKHYERHATVTQWVETFLIFAYPFAPETRKTEDVYVAFLDNIFREIEADRVLAAQ